MFITNTGRATGGWFWAVGLAGTMALLGGGSQAARAAKPDVSRRTAPVAVQQIADYAAATEAARAAGGMLLVSVEPAGAGDTDAAGGHLVRPEVHRLFAASGTPWIFCRIGMDQGGGDLAADPALSEMRRGPGVFVVDHGPGDYAGRIVSILPRSPGKYYRFSPEHIDELAALPRASLTQRSLILAVRLHPEQPQSTAGTCDPVLCQEAAAHSVHQASIRRQGHHDWQTRSQRITGALGGLGSAAEVCAESWPHQDLLDSCVDCVASWRQSSGHWNAVRSQQSAYGYDIRRGGNGIWYATGIFMR
jgi:hypothetical protein